MWFSPLRWVFILPIALILVPILGIGGLYGLRQVESYNPFCTSCHLQDHQDYMDDARRSENAIRTLGGWHLAGGKVECISCHGEDGLAGMTRTTYLAAKDSIKFIIGDYEQPSRVFHPIKNKDCQKCHGDERILKLGDDDFHAILDHSELPFACVQCHNGHRTGGRKARRFIVPKTAQPRCDSCHDELDQKVRVGSRAMPEKRIRMADLKGLFPAE